MAVCAVTDDPKMVKTLFVPEGNGNECNLVVGDVAVVGSSLCQLVPRMSQLTLGVAVAQSETRSPPSAARSSPPSPKSFKNYNLMPAEQDKHNKFLKGNLEKGYIRKSESPMASPFFFIKKKDSKL